MLIEASRNRIGRILRSTNGPVLQRDEGDAGILAGTRERVATHRDDTVDGLFLQRDLLDLLDHIERTVGRGFGRRCTSTIRKPWSSLGRNEPGSRI